MPQERERERERERIRQLEKIVRNSSICTCWLTNRTRTDEWPDTETTPVNSYFPPPANKPTDKSVDKPTETSTEKPEKDYKSLYNETLKSLNYETHSHEQTLTTLRKLAQDKNFLQTKVDLLLDQNQDINRYQIAYQTSQTKLRNLTENYENLLNELAKIKKKIAKHQKQQKSQSPPAENWKTRWLRGSLIAATTYFGYQAGSQASSQTPPNSSTLALTNNSLNTTQLYDYQNRPVNYNQTHSWSVSELAQTTEASQFLDNFAEQFNSPTCQLSDTTELIPSQANSENQELSQQIRQNQKLTFKLNQQKNKITELEKRPTSEQLNQAVQQEKSRYQHLVDPAIYRTDWINPADLEAQARAKGMVSATEYQKLLNNQKPLDLPKNWKSELAKIPKLEKNHQELQQNHNSLNSKYQKELAQKTTQLAQLTADLTTAQNLKVQAENQLNTANTDLAIRANELNAIQKKLTNTRTALTNAEAERDRRANITANELTILQTNLTNERDKVIRQRDARAEIPPENLIILQNKLNTSNQQITSLTNQLNNLNSNLLNQKNQHKLAIAHLKAKNKKLLNTLTTTEREKNQTRTALKTANDNLNARTVKLREVNEALAQTHTELTASQRTAEQAKRNAETAKTEAGRIARKSQETQADAETAQIQAQNNLNNLKLELENYKQRPNITQTTYENLLKQHQQIQTNLEQWTNIFKNQTAQAVNQAKNALKAKINTAQEAQTKAEQQAKEAKSTNDKLKSELNTKIQAYNSLNQNKIQLELRLLTKQSIVDTLTHKYSQARNEKETLKSTNQEIITNLKSQLTNQTTAYNSLKSKNIQAQANLEALNQQLNETHQEKIRLQRKNQKLTKKLSQTQTHQTKTEKQNKTQNSYLTTILNHLASAGIGYLATPTPKQTLSKSELETLVQGVNVLIQQRNSAQQEAEQLKEQIASHECSVSQIPCSHSNYQSQQETNIKIETIQQNSEQEIINELNTTLHLNLQNPSLKSVIAEIQRRIAKDPVVVEKDFAPISTTLHEVEQELISQETPFGEDLEIIKDLEIKSLAELLPNKLEANFISQIQKAKNYQQLTKIRNNFLAKHLAKAQKGENDSFNENQEIIQTLPELKSMPVKSDKERIIWISLLVVSVSIGGLLVKMSKKNKKLN